MAIKVEFIAHYRLITGVPSIELDLNDITIMEAIDELGRRYGSKFVHEVIDRDGKLLEDILFLKNEDLIKDKNEKLRDGDVLVFIPPAFGG